MLELLKEFSGKIVGVRASGLVTKKDYEDVLISAVEAAVQQHGKVRMYYEFGPDFTGMDAGAMWEDFAIGMKEIAHWERCAVITDAAWIVHGVNAFRFLMPCPVKVFPLAGAAAAHEWIAA